MNLKIHIVLNDIAELKNTLEQIESIRSQSVESINVEIIVDSNRPSHPMQLWCNSSFLQLLCHLLQKYY